MGGCRCAFLNCPVNTERNPGMHFFHFPSSEKNKDRFMKWVQYSNASHILNLVDSQQKNKVVCGRHFRDLNFMNYKQDRLVAIAVPTIHRLDEIYALDYSIDPKNPVLVEIPKPTAAHLIPPEGYPSPLCLNEQDRKICVEMVAKYGKPIIPIPTNPAEPIPVATKERSMNTAIEVSAKKINLGAHDLLAKNVVTEIEIQMVKSSRCEAWLRQTNEMSSSSADNNMLHIEPIEINSQNIESPKSIEQASTDQQQQPYSVAAELLLQKRIKRKKVAHALSERLLAEKLNELEELKMKLVNETKELETTERKLDLFKKEVIKLKTTLKDLSQSKADSQAELELKRKEHDQLKKKNRCIISAYADLQEKYKKLQESYNSLEQRQHQQKEVSSTVRQPVEVPQQQFTKPQLFNGIKKYLSQNMAALLRIQLASGSAEREWKPDERRLAVDLLNLGEEVYKHFTDEWLIRLPLIRQVRAWSEENTIEDEEEEL